MKNLVVLAALAALAPVVEAKVWITVYRYDGVTPFPAVDPNHPDVYRDLMVGTRLTLIISSDAAGSWGGELLVPWADAPNGKLSGRGYVTAPHGFWSPTYQGSCLDAAGALATARDDLNPSKGVGFSLSNDAAPISSHPAYPGDWFVVDYHAERVGECRVDLYGFTWGGPVASPVTGPSVSPEALVQTLSFTQVPTRDFNGDRTVNFKDLAVLAAHWNSSIDPKSPDAVFDLNADGRIDLGDLALFSEHWLERTDYDAP